MKREALTPYFLQALASGQCTLFSEAEAQIALPPRPFDAHKGDNGRGLLLAGSFRYPGAALLAGQSALGGGCGVLEVISTESARLYYTRLPEAVFSSVGDGWTPYSVSEIAPRLKGKTAFAAGCGWGEEEQDHTFSPILISLLSSNLPGVLDADALNHLSRHKELYSLLHEKIVLTPHPGEMARLTGLDIWEIAQDPMGVAAQFSKEHHCTVLLKGTVTVIAGGGACYLTAEGNSGLAKGGSGDTLTGLVLAMLCQKKTPVEAACLGSYLLGAGAQKAFALLKERMLRASHVAEAMQML